MCTLGSYMTKPMSIIVWLLKAKNGQNPEKSDTKMNLVPLDAEFSAE